MFRKNKTISLPVQGAAPPNGKTEANEAGPWYQAGLRFKCTQCGNCCSGSPGYVWITPEDWVRIAAFLGITVEEFTKRYVKRVAGGMAADGEGGMKYSLIEKPNYDCVFLQRENGKAMCGIYPVRPIQCRTWPFWNQNLKSPKAWAVAAEGCPGMRDAAAPQYDLPIIEKRRAEGGGV